MKEEHTGKLTFPDLKTYQKAVILYKQCHNGIQDRCIDHWNRIEILEVHLTFMANRFSSIWQVNFIKKEWSFFFFQIITLILFIFALNFFF